MKVQRIDHVGVNVTDLPAAKTFFLDLGLELHGEGAMEGALLDRVVGLEGAKTSFAWFRAPGGQTSIELVKYHTPVDEHGLQQPSANTLGIRHIAIAVEDIEATVARLKERGTQTFSEIQDYEGVYKLCYVRGPEGMILELAEQIR